MHRVLDFFGVYEGVEAFFYNSLCKIDDLQRGQRVGKFYRFRHWLHARLHKFVL